jgi:hypothetical protein
MAEIRSSLVNGSSGECKEQPNNASSPCTSPPMYRAVIPVRFKAIGLPWPGSVYVPTPVGIVTGSWSGISYNPMIYGAHNSWFGHYNVKVFVYP